MDAWAIVNGFIPLRWGVDSLYLSYPGMLADSVTRKLETLKKTAQAELESEQARAQYCVQDHVFEVKDKGSGIFPFVLRDNAFRIALSRPKSGSLPMAYVQVSSQMLAAFSPQRAEATLSDVLLQMGDIEPARTSRIDLYVDFVCDVDMEDWSRHAWVTRAHNIQSYSCLGEFSGWSVAFCFPEVCKRIISLGLGQCHGNLRVQRVIPSARGDSSGFQSASGAIPVTNAQRRAASRKAEIDPLRNDRKPEATPPLNSTFQPHEAGAYFLAAVDTVGTFKMFAKDPKPPTYTYSVTTVRFELNPETGTWIWFDGAKNLYPRKTQDGWRLGSKRLHDTREGAEAELQREMAKNGDRVTKVHDLPDDMTALKKIRSAHHPDRNPDSDVDLYQAVIEKLDRMRAVSL